MKNYLFKLCYKTDVGIAEEERRRTGAEESRVFIFDLGLGKQGTED